MIQTPFSPLFLVSRGKGYTDHNNAVALIAWLLRSAGYEVNYDHLQTIVPRNKNIPLKTPWEGDRKKKDLAYIDENGNLVLISINTVDKKTLKRWIHDEG